jgi:parvulin-like peptidyl-prolyl isomerase
LSRKRRPEPKLAVAKRKPPRWQRDQNISRFLWIVIPLVIALIVVLVGYWGYDTYVAPWGRAVAQVNGTTLNMDYLVKMVRFFSAINGSAVDPKQVAQAIEENELVRQKAAALGIAVTPEEVTAAIADAFPVQSVTVAPTPSPAGNESAGSTGNDTTGVVIVEPTPSPGNSTGPPPEIGESYGQWLTQIKLSDKEYRRIVETSLLGQRLQDYFTEQVPAELEQVYLHIIPVDTEATANEVLDRLRAGQDFSTLAGEYSVIEDVKNAQGDIGWVPRGLFPDLDDVIFNLGIGNVSDPVATSQGYDILKVTGYVESMPVADEYRTQIGRNDFESWLKSEREAKVQEYLDQSAIDWATSHSA